MKYFISRKDRIILSAIDIISELGIQGLSTKELALRQEINESALYRHFKNKEAIVKGVLDYFSQFDNSIYNTAMKKESSGKEKIVDYLKSYLEYYESYPAISSILFLYENISRDVELRNQIEGIFNTRLNNIISIIAECQKNNEISSNFTPKELAQILFGYCNKVILDWRIANFSYSYKDDATATIEKLLILIDNKTK
jgi:AcrR family transcriptional regulator